MRSIQNKGLLNILSFLNQWYETADTNEVAGVVHEGDHDSHHETTYSYAKDWFDKRISSESFANPMGHHNTEYWPYNSSVRKNLLLCQIILFVVI